MKDCSIVEDLLPLYNEGLLQEDTKEWLEEHLKTCSSCVRLESMSTEPMTKEEITSPIDYEKMMAKNKFKLSMYQLIFVGISFFIAIRAVLLEDISFILPYAVLGFVTYIFYKNYYIVMFIAFVPVFLWQFTMLFPEYNEVGDYFEGNIGELILGFIPGAVIWAAIHLLFALIGATVGLFTLKLFGSRDQS